MRIATALPKVCMVTDGANDLHILGILITQAGGIIVD